MGKTTTDQPASHTTNQDVDHTDQPSASQLERISIEEAADRLNISQNAVRQRIKRGTLAGDRMTSPWLVLWSETTTDQPTTRPTSGPITKRPSTTTTGSDEHRQRISDLEADRDRWHDQTVRKDEQLAEAAAALQREQDTARGLVVALARAEQRAEIAESRIESLTASTDDEGAGESTEKPPESPEDAQEPAGEAKIAHETGGDPSSGSFWAYIRRHVLMKG